ncbi:hypothetical protein STENM327S_05104 [Streptomyces tendae]
MLGAVRQHGRAHGYQVRNDLEPAAHEWSNAKPGSIYHALKQMAKQGLLRVSEEPSTGGRAGRRPDGTEEFAPHRSREAAARRAAEKERK